MSIKTVPFGNSGASVLGANIAVKAGQYLTSENKVYSLRLRVDGHLVLEKRDTVVWVADDKQTFSATIHQKCISESLHFVVSNSGFLYDPGRNRIWIAVGTETLDKSYWYNNCLRLTDEGNIVIYDKRNGAVRWARYGFVPGKLPKPRLIGHAFYDASIPVWDWRF